MQRDNLVSTAVLMLPSYKSTSVSSSSFVPKDRLLREAQILLPLRNVSIAIPLLYPFSPVSPLKTWSPRIPNPHCSVFPNNVWLWPLSVSLAKYGRGTRTCASTLPSLKLSLCLQPPLSLEHPPAVRGTFPIRTEMPCRHAGLLYLTVFWSPTQ